MATCRWQHQKTPVYTAVSGTHGGSYLPAIMRRTRRSIEFLHQSTCGSLCPVHTVSFTTELLLFKTCENTWSCRRCCCRISHQAVAVGGGVKSFSSPDNYWMKCDCWLENQFRSQMFLQVSERWYGIKDKAKSQFQWATCTEQHFPLQSFL